MRWILFALVFLPFVAINAIVWRYVPCEWSHPYAY